MNREFIATFSLDKNEGQTATFCLEENTINASFSIAEKVLIKDKYFIFDQATSSDTWTINHDLDKKPSITVVDEYDRVITGFEAQYESNNLIIIRFNFAFKGKAYLN